jgi:hypothetical protein
MHTVVQRPKLRERESSRRLRIIRRAGLGNQSVNRAGDVIFGSRKGKSAQRVKYWRRSREIPFNGAKISSAAAKRAPRRRKSLQRSENRLGRAECRLNEANFGWWKKKSPRCAENRHRGLRVLFNEPKIASTRRKSVQTSRTALHRRENRDRERERGTAGRNFGSL